MFDFGHAHSQWVSVSTYVGGIYIHKSLTIVHPLGAGAQRYDIVYTLYFLFLLFLKDLWIGLYFKQAPPLPTTF